MNYKHGMARHGTITPTYRSWQSMHKRCAGKASNSKYYVGITVCGPWVDFVVFLKDMGERPSGTTLDRYPKQDGNYEPGNCRWATKEQQMQNKRNNVHLTFNGETRCVAEWGRRLGIPPTRISSRLYRGYSTEDALSLGMLPKGPRQR